MKANSATREFDRYVSNLRHAVTVTGATEDAPTRTGGSRLRQVLADPYMQTVSDLNICRFSSNPQKTWRRGERAD